MNFNPEANEFIRRKLMNVREIFVPSRDEKFEKIIEGMVETNNVKSFLIFQEKIEYRKNILHTDSSLSGDFDEDPHLLFNQQYQTLKKY